MQEDKARILKDRINYLMPLIKEKHPKEVLEDMLFQIDCLIEENNNGWISVTERLPECIEQYGISKTVWCLDAHERTGFGIYQNGKVQLQHEGWFTGGGVGEDSVKITHWMSLPELPKTE